MVVLAWAALGFASGSLPFAVWLGRGLAHADVRQVGDGNPGAANAWRAGGWRVGVAALLLDFLKGALPVGAAHFAGGLSGLGLAAAALAPVLGHAFSPLLGFRGGKALAVTFGIWAGLTLGEVPIVLGLMMVLFYCVQTADAWAVVFSFSGLLAHLWLRGADPALLAAGTGNFLVLLWKHRRELRESWGHLRIHPRLLRKLDRRAPAAPARR